MGGNARFPDNSSLKIPVQLSSTKVNEFLVIKCCRVRSVR